MIHYRSCNYMDENKNYNMKHIPLKNIFNIKKGNAKYTKKYIDQNKGEYPVYSSQTTNDGIIGKIKTFDHLGKCITYTTDGIYAGTVFYRVEKFNMTTHCGAIYLKDEYNSKINLKYVYCVLKNILRSHSVGVANKRLTLRILENVKIPIPININKLFDFSLQKKIVEKYDLIDYIQNEIKEQFSKLNDAELNLSDGNTTKKFLVSDIFEFPKSNAKMTRSFCQKNKGIIPVYASSKSEHVVLGKIKPNMDKIKYHENCLTWNRNGSVGYFFYRSGVFTTNEDHRVLKTKVAYEHKIYPIYLKHILQKTIKQLGYNYQNKLGSNKIGNIVIELHIKNGELNIDQQKKIATIYEKAYSIKNEISNQLEQLCTLKILYV